MLETLSFNLFNNEDLIAMLIVASIVTALITGIFYWLKTFDKGLRAKEKELNSRKLNKLDMYIMILLTALYAIFSLWNLGSLKAANSYWQPVSAGETVTFELTEKTEFEAIVWVSGEGNSEINPNNLQYGTDFQVVGSNDLVEWTHITTLENASYMTWKVNDGLIWNFRYIQIISPNQNSVLHEIGFRTTDKQFLPIQYLEQSNPTSGFSGSALIDEQDTLPLEITYINGVYFDEIYHTRNAYEIAEGQPMYSSVHPLLGTSLIALGIKIFGLNPFGWRIMGALFGIMMVPLMYILAKMLFKKTRYATMATLFLSLDFMHFTTSRIGTLEPFSVFFILLMTTFMIRYTQMNFYRDKLYKTLIVLGLSGLTMGIACATKWTGVYGALGLAILFFITLWKRYVEYVRAVESPNKNDYERHIVDNFWDNTIITIAFCIFAFIIIPVIIYFAVYMMCEIYKGQPWSIGHVIDYTKGIFNYHMTLDATHPFQSTWWMWMLDIRSMWYYHGVFGNQVSSISALGHPFIWWSGFIALFVTAYNFIKKKNDLAMILLICFLVQLVPWMRVDRCVFIYHYYPSVPFLILSLVYVLKTIEDKNPHYKKHIHYFIVACIILFIMFLPAIGGFKTTAGYLKDVLRWFPTWYFG